MYDGIILQSYLSNLFKSIMTWASVHMCLKHYYTCRNFISEWILCNFATLQMEENTYWIRKEQLVPKTLMITICFYFQKVEILWHQNLFLFHQLYNCLLLSLSCSILTYYIFYETPTCYKSIWITDILGSINLLT